MAMTDSGTTAVARPVRRRGGALRPALMVVGAVGLLGLSGCYVYPGDPYAGGGYYAPSYSAPRYSTPSYSTPGYYAPSYSAPTYSAPSYYAPNYYASPPVVTGGYGYGYGRR